MDAEDSVEVVGGRKRTESGGGHSDSDLSDGWNIIDHLDVPSSDGESVEVIGTDEESHDHNNERSMVAEMPPPPPPAEVVPAEERREEMFDSSFCWFLFFAAGTVLVSNLTFMAAENFFAWDVGFPTESPSFLRDLPTTPKQIQQVENPFKISWAENEEADVETVDDSKIGNEVEGTSEGFNKLEYRRTAYRTSKDFNVNEKSTLLPHDNNNVLNYLKVLSDTAGTPEMQEKLNQALLILDSLQSGLNDLEDGVGEHSELSEMLSNQINQITKVVGEIHSGVVRSMEKIANNVLSKVNKLEKKFENQWCKLEKKGYKEAFTGLFFDCQDGKRRNNKQNADKNTKNKNDEKRKHYNQMIINSYQFEVDKDSTGKAYNIPKSENGEINEYYNLVNKEHVQNNKKDNVEGRKIVAKGAKHEKDQFDFQPDMKLDSKDAKMETKGESKRLHKKEHEKKYEKNNVINENNENYYKGKDFNDKSYTYSNKNLKNDHVEDKRNDFNNKKGHFEDHESHSKKHKDNFEIKIDDYKHNFKNSMHLDDTSDIKHGFHKSIGDNLNNNEYINQKYISQDEKLNEKKYKKSYNTDMLNEVKHSKYNEPAVEVVGQYLIETCKNNGDIKLSNAPNDYKKIKEEIYKLVRIPNNVFDNLFNRYCNSKSDDNSFGQEKYGKRYQKDNYKKRNKKKDNIFPNNAVVIESPDAFVKTVMNVRVVEEGKSESEDNVITPARAGLQQWVFLYEEPPSNNKTDVKGDWFIRAGESRSKARWAHSRGDWWFERATHRRRHPSPPHGRNNWQFLRAWARHRCRQRPNDFWCSFPHKEFFSNENSNYR